jgi:hypothetical protein
MQESIVAHRKFVTAAVLTAWLGLISTAALAGQSSAPAAPPATGQPEPTPPAPASSQTQKPLVSDRELDRIKRVLTNSKSPILKLDDLGFRYYVEIVAKQPTFAEYAKGYDFVNGPTRRGNPMTHQEFLQMVTPRDFYSSAGIKPTEILQMAVTNWLGQTLIKNAIEEMLKARTERERDEIRARIDRELAALRDAQNTSQ